IELGLYAEAVRLLRQEGVKTDRGITERKWGEILHRYHLPIELLYNQAKDANNELLKALRAGQQQNQLRFQIRLLRAIDPESSEIAETIFRHSESHRRDEDHDRHRRPFEIWVEGRDDEPEENDSEFKIEELIPRVVNHAINIANTNKLSARILATLVTEVDPNSKSADKVSALIKKLSILTTNKLGSRIVTEEGKGADLFGTKQVRSYHIELSDSAIQQLHEDPKHYVRATFREGDDVYKEVGVRLKGGPGSFRMLEGNSKAAFTVKFNHFVKGQRFHGLRRIILNNAVQDPTYMCEYIGYGLFRDAGVPAPRIGYATVAVNQEPYGLYVQVEAVSNDFLKRWYSKTEGNLYEGSFRDVVEWRELDLDSNQGRENRRDLRRLAKSIEKADDNNPWESLADYVDLGNFTRFIALEQLVNHWDGYTQTNNYRMYYNPETKKFEFFPHGADQLFQDVRGNIFGDQRGILSRALVQTDSGKQRYCQMMNQLLEQVWDESKIKSRIAETYRLIHPYIVTDLEKSRRLEEFEESIRRMLRFIDARRYAVLSQLQSSEQSPSWREYRRTGFHSYLIHY
ncbi:MAG: CotH kinase family protein, partial [Dehalococcoidia bacterium]|nr:CotH kinase family protein [Dehalococcoidia bacterium]